MRQPITFAWRNIVFGRDADDAWALLRLRASSYSHLPASGKRELFAAIASFAFTVEADFQLLRVSRRWSADEYRSAAVALADERWSRKAAFAQYLASHEQRLATAEVWRPELYLAVRLGGAAVKAETLLRRWRRLAGLGDPRGISRARLDELLAEEATVFARVADFLDCERATVGDLQWLIRRAFTRGIGEPILDERWRPQAMVVDAGDDAQPRFVPLEADVLRLFETPLRVGARAIAVDDDTGQSSQAFLVAGALPEVVTFPGRPAELLFAPIEALGFPVDVAVCAEWIANDRAVALARRKVLDADHIYADESSGDHGASASGAERPAAARELEDYLTSADRPPLLRTTIGLALGASSPDELEARVERLRREFAPVMLHRPRAAQLDLFVSHLPAQRPAIRGYEDILLCEQLGAMVPLATHAVGPHVGFYLGRTLSGSGQPVLLDLTEGPRTSRPPAILLTGPQGSGKTLTAQLLAYQRYLAGSRIVLVDPKGDHRLDGLVPAEDVEHIELSPAHRGLLDPLRIASDDTRADLAYSFLVDLLPAPVPAPWQTELRHAVDAMAAAGGRSSGEVLHVLERGEDAAREAARAIRVHAASGLLQLGFADADQPAPTPGAGAVTALRIANLTLPVPGTARSELTWEERVGKALLRLLATYALKLMGEDWSRHKVLVFDEAWMLLNDAAGRALLDRMNRLCRSQNATPLLLTQTLAEVDELDALLGAVMCFGAETDREAGRALTLLGLDPDEPRARSELRGFRRGKCLLRDYEGGVGAVQVDAVDPALLDALDTTPR